MNKNVFTAPEFKAKANLSEKTLAEWLKLRLVRPVGFTDDKTPLFSEAALDGIEHIRKLQDLGYGLEDIQRIIRKVGVPRAKAEAREPSPKERYLTVGTLAERSGVSPRTIKHWEDKGIIEPDMHSKGGFRLYSQVFVFLCKLIKDLQLFGYALEEIKVISGYFRDFLSLQDDLESFAKADAASKLETMLGAITALFDKMELFKEGIGRWEDLLKKKKKEILSLKERNQKRSGPATRRRHA